jgi:23S rRNA (adenine2503-C2)-methyltransferase
MTSPWMERQIAKMPRCCQGEAVLPCTDMGSLRLKDAPFVELALHEKKGVCVENKLRCVYTSALERFFLSPHSPSQGILRMSAIHHDTEAVHLSETQLVPATEVTAAPTALQTAASASIAPNERIDLLDFTREALEQYFIEQGDKAFRARQIFRWIYKQGVTDIAEMTDLSRAMREHLLEFATISSLEVVRVMDSIDGTKKILFRLKDGAQVEAVLIPIGRRITLCISSQVGCALGCRFCYTATMGPGRNLTIAEYMGQFLGSARLLPEGKTITNVVFMGMGEPLINFQNLIGTLSILTDELGPKLGARRLTVSTAGLCPQILKLGETFPVRLALSLHATTDAQRDQIMPINQRYNLKALFDTLRTFQKLPTQQSLPVTLEYTLIQDINDSPEDAKRLIKLSRSVRSKINLIPYNEHPGAPYKRPSQEAIAEFLRILQVSGVLATERQTRGDDILAACGQLALDGEAKKIRRPLPPR